MNRLSPNNIRLTGEKGFLTTEERIILEKIRNKKLLFIASTYGTLVVVLIIGWIKGWLESTHRGEEETNRFSIIAPFLIAFFFIMLTGYFIKYYIKAVHPFVLDLKRGNKELVYFTPEKYKTPFFAEYFLKTELKKKKLVRISLEMYDSIQYQSSACIYLAPVSQFVFKIVVDDKSISFSDKHEPVA